jgi:hypothetical protein
LGKKIVHAILQLPSCQRYAIACSLNDQLDSVHPLFIAMFLDYGIDIKAARWPTDQAQLRSLKTSLVIARKKLRSRLAIMA